MTVFRADSLSHQPRRWRLQLRVCGWCKCFLGVKRATSWGTTHGICRHCAEELHRQRVAKGLLLPHERARRAGL